MNTNLLSAGNSAASRAGRNIAPGIIFQSSLSFGGTTFKDVSLDVSGYSYTSTGYVVYLFNSI